MSKEERWEKFLKTCEYPFARSGMTPKEFKAEHIYYLDNLDNAKKGIYVPMWEQRTINKEFEIIVDECGNSYEAMHVNSCISDSIRGK